MHSVAISPARWEDVDAIRAVSDACLDHDYVLDMLDAFLASGSVLVARDVDTPVGYVKVERALDDSSWLSALRVVPNHRRLGIGARLCRACEVAARRAGSTLLRLWTSRHNAPAMGLFEALTYRRVGSFTRWWGELDQLHSASPSRPADAGSAWHGVHNSTLHEASGGYAPVELKFCRLDASLLETLRASHRLYRDRRGAACVLDGESWSAFGDPTVELTLLGDDVRAQVAAAAGFGAERDARYVGAFLPAGPAWDRQAEAAGLQPASWGRFATLYEKDLAPASQG